MKLTWGRRKPVEAAPAPHRGCGHTRIEPMSATWKAERNPFTGLALGVPTNALLNGLCMDCGQPVEFEMGRVGGKPSDHGNWTRVMRANGYMQNAANTALWEKVV